MCLYYSCVNQTENRCNIPSCLCFMYIFSHTIGYQTLDKCERI